MHILRPLTILTIIIAFFVIMLGAYTRLSDAGLGCPDWPGCYGHLNVIDAVDHVNEINSTNPDSLREASKTIPEMVHRYLAGLLGLLILAINLVLWKFIRRRRYRKRYYFPLKHAGFLLALVIFQAILGMLTVTQGLHPVIVLAHLLGGFATFALLVIFYSRLIYQKYQPADYPPHLEKLIIAAFIMLGIQIALGGWTSANYAAVACTDLPVCEQGWQDKLDYSEAFSFWNIEAQKIENQKADFEYGVLSHNARVTIHITHRFGALITFILLLITFIAAIRQSKPRVPTSLKIFCYLGIGLLGLQVALGIANVVYKLPIGIAVAHNNVAALLFAVMAILLYWLVMKNAQKPAVKI